MTSKPKDPRVEGDIASLTTAKVQQSPRRLLLSAVAVLAVLGIFASTRAADPVEEARSNTTTSTTTSTISTTQPAGGDTAVVDTAIAAATPGCDATRLAEALSRGMVAPSSPTRANPTFFAELSPYIVRGQLIEANPRDGGTRILVKPRQVINKPGVEPIQRFDALWTPAIDPPSGILDGNFVAFLTGERTEAGWVTRLDGFWVGCDDTSPAVSVLNRTSDADLSLNDLWLTAPVRSNRLEPTALVGGAAIFSVDVADGSRFRISLPQHLAADLIQTSDSTPASPVRIEGSAASIEILYQFCPGADNSAFENSFGSLVWLDFETARVCRERDQLRMHVIADWAGNEDDLAMLDVRALSIGWDYRMQLLGVDPTDVGCFECKQEFGPLSFPEQEVIVTTTSATAVTAHHERTLEELWTLDPGGSDTFLVHGGDGLFVDAVGRSLLKLDPSTGQELWRLDRGADERAVGLSGELTWASFIIEGDHTAPILRRIDSTTGQTVWTARGRTGTEWERSRPTVIDGVVVMMDQPDYGGAAPPDTALHAFDYETGELMWTTSLGDSPNRGSVGGTEFADFENGRVLLARTMYSEFLRVNVSDGEIMWRTTVSNGEFGGTDFAANDALAIDIRTPNDRHWLLDHETGEVLQPEPK